MEKKIRWGILGCGKIARKFASDLQLVDAAILQAVGSSDGKSAKQFAEEFPVQTVHTSYEELASDPDVDIIYIATPHAFHPDHTTLCLDHGKAVLCEKAFALNSKQASAMIEKAKSKKIFLLEALWSQFLPHYEKMRAMIQDGQLGNIQSANFQFGFKPVPPIASRIFDPALGGGSLLDIGIYNVFFALSIMGMPDQIEASAKLTDEFVDEQCAVLFKYRDGRFAQLFSTFNSNLSTEGHINGDNGRIKLTNRFYEHSATLEFYKDFLDSRELIEVKKEKGYGYQYEARHATECMQKGLTESPVMTHSDTLQLMKVLDSIREKAGIKYPADND